MKYRFIKQLAEDLLTRVNYVDEAGRQIGFDYGHILACLKREFPESNTSQKELQKIAYNLNAIRLLPVRRRQNTRRLMAINLVRALLLSVKAPKAVRNYVRRRFPEQDWITTARVREMADDIIRSRQDSIRRTRISAGVKAAWVRRHEQV